MIKVVSLLKIHDPGETDERIVKALAEDIKFQGLLNPIMLRPTNNGRYKIVDGLYRVRATKLLGHKTIEAQIMEHKKTGD